MTEVAAAVFVVALAAIPYLLAALRGERVRHRQRVRDWAIAHGLTWTDSRGAMYALVPDRGRVRVMAL